MAAVTSKIAMSSFFFQAEDGIRDYKVTGVQTCALPILVLVLGTSAHRSRARARALAVALGLRSSVRFSFLCARAPPRTCVLRVYDRRVQIGRASCRERV